MKLVRVDWIDSEGDGKWIDKGEFLSWCDSSAIPISSFGLLAYEDDNHVVLVQSVNENQIDSRLKIPRSVITNIAVRYEETDVEL